MDFGEIQLGDNDNTDLKKERRFSVHDVDSTDNEVSYEQPDNPAMDDVSAMRIASVDDSETPHTQSTRLGSHDHGSDNDEDQNGVFIHENVDNTYEEYGGNDSLGNEYTPHSPNLDAARGSKEATPDHSHNTTEDKEYYDPSHYRHPSLAAHENPASDDEDMDKDHNRFLSTLIHETAEDDSDYDPSPRAQERNEHLVYQKNVSRLRDYWCHSSAGIAIEDDTDAKVLRDKVGPHGTPKPASDMNQHHINMKGSVHEINNYTRPFMSKIEDNSSWDNVFGHGIISDTHNKYIARENGRFIEWIIEVNNMTSQKEAFSTIVIGFSADLSGEINQALQGAENGAFTTAKHGFGFDNLGHVLNGSKEIKSDAIRREDSLHFDSRDVVHIILDYSDVNNWVFYAKVGDIEDADYDDLESASKSNKITTVFDKINPGSYRLAVALFSQMDSLIIESCKIHGTEQGAFYQELKSYSTNEQKDEQDESAEQPVVETSTATKDDDDDESKQIETEPVTNEATDEEADEKVEQSPETEDDIQTVDAPRSVPRKMTVIVHDVEESDEEETPPKQIETVQEEEEMDDMEDLEDDDEKAEDNNNNNEKQAKMKAFVPQKSFIVHDEGDQHKIEEQSQLIADLKSEIKSLEAANGEKEKLMEAAAEKERKQKEKMDELRESLNEYRLKAEAAQSQVAQLSQSQVSAEERKEQQQEQQKQTAQITQLSDENGRLSHELKLAQDRLKSLDDKKQEMQAKLQNAIETKMKLIIATSEEIDHYRKLIQQIAQNKLGCQVLSDLDGANNNNNNNNVNGRNGYY